MEGGGPATATAGRAHFLGGCPPACACVWMWAGLVAGLVLMGGWMDIRGRLSLCFLPSAMRWWSLSDAVLAWHDGG